MAPGAAANRASHRAASDGRDAPRYHRARLGEREAPGRVRALERVKKKKTTVRKSRRLDPRRTSGGRRLDARATEGETVSRRERGPGRGRAPRRDDVSARRAVSSGPSRALHAGFHIVRLVRFFHPGRPVRHTGPVRLRSRCPTDRPEAGRGGFPRHSRWRRMHPRRPSARAGVRRHPPGRARAFTLANARLVDEGRAGPRVCVGWRSAPGKRRSVPLVRIRRALTEMTRGIRVGVSIT